MRSGSGTSRTTATSDSGDPESLYAGQLSSSPSQPSTGSSSVFLSHPPSSTAATFVAGTSKGSLLSPPSNLASALSPIASRMRERGAEAMERYLNRNRSGSQGTTSTDHKSNGSQYASAGPSTNGDDITALKGGSITPRKLRPSVSAAQLRADDMGNKGIDIRNRSETIPIPIPTTASPMHSRPSLAKTLRSIASMDRLKSSEPIESYTGPPQNFSRFPDPPFSTDDYPVAPPNTRRKAFLILGKPLQGFETASGSNHRRGMSSASIRGS